MFLAYQRDPRRAFVPIQQALARSDAMGEYLLGGGGGEDERAAYGRLGP